MLVMPNWATGTIYYTLSDHLPLKGAPQGSASVITNDSSGLLTEYRYKAWGESRYASGTVQTAYQCTGHRSPHWPLKQKTGTMRILLRSPRRVARGSMDDYSDFCGLRKRFVIIQCKQNTHNKIITAKILLT